MEAEKSQSLLQSVNNGFRILRLFTAEKPEWRVTEIARVLDMDKSTVSRLVITLANEDFLEKSPDSSRYRLGFSLLTLSGIITTNLEIHREALPILKDLVNQLNETAHIAILEENDIVYLHKIECKQPVRLLSHIGKRNRAFCTSSGKVILAYSSENTVEKVIKAGFTEGGPNSVTDPQTFRRQLKEVRANEYSVCIDELHEGTVSLAAPIRDYTGSVVAAVSIVGPSMRIGPDRIQEFVDALKQSGSDISRRLGFNATYQSLTKTH